MYKQQRELYGQCDWLFVTAVVREFPLGCLRVENHIVGKMRETCLDVSGRSSRVAGEYVAPVALAVDEVLLLSHLHQRTGNGCIAVRVILHSVSHHVRNLVVTAVVELAHGVQYTALNRFQSVVKVWHRTFQNHIRRIVQKPVLVHARQLVRDWVTTLVGVIAAVFLVARVPILIYRVLGGIVHLLDILVKSVVLHFGNEFIFCGLQIR